MSYWFHPLLCHFTSEKHQLVVRLDQIISKNTSSTNHESNSLGGYKWKVLLFSAIALSVHSQSCHKHLYWSNNWRNILGNRGVSRWHGLALCGHHSPQTSYNNASGYHSCPLVFNKHLPIRDGPLVAPKIITAGSKESIHILSHR